MAETVAIIPARFGASRFPGKPLVDLCGKPMVQRVWEQAMQAKNVDRVIIATDDKRIEVVARAFGAEVAMTPPSCPTGTDRIAVAARRAKVKSNSLVVNVQGDEPLIPPQMIDQSVRLIKKNKSAVMGTLSRDLKNAAECGNPNVVKVLSNCNLEALYFSRAEIPFLRSTGKPWLMKGVKAHIGLYVYRADFLQKFTRLKKGEFEQVEQLEQLRVLENGFRILVENSKYTSMAVDTPEDAKKVRQLIRRQRG